MSLSHKLYMLLVPAIIITGNISEAKNLACVAISNASNTAGAYMDANLNDYDNNPSSVTSKNIAINGKNGVLKLLISRTILTGDQFPSFKVGSYFYEFNADGTLSTTPTDFIISMIASPSRDSVDKPYTLGTRGVGATLLCEVQ